LTAKLIAGTEGPAEQPFFSPDGKWIGYCADRQLKKIAISGGTPVTICSITAQGMVGAGWNADNTIVYGQIAGDIMRISANGGTPASIIKAKSATSAFPHMLPDGKSVLYTDSAGPSQGNVMVQSLESGKTKVLLAGFSLGYLPTGHIIYGLPNDNHLYASPFDLNSMEVKGGPIPMVEGVMGNGRESAVSGSGTLVYVSATGSTAINRRAFVWVGREGKEEPLAAQPNAYYDYFKISPDGTRIALTIIVDGNYDLWIWDLARKTMTRLTFDNAFDGLPIWTPDSHRIIFESFREGRESIFWKAADGSGKVEKLASVQDRNIYPWSVSSDGKTLFLGESGGESGYDIGMLSMEGGRTPKLLLQEKYGEDEPQISPDGRWIAYESDESGRWEIYVRSFPDVESGGRWQVSASGGEFPLWAPNGKELFYRSPDAIMAVPVETKPTLKLGTPKSLFPNRYVGQFDISPDGKRFLMLKPAPAADEKTKAEAPQKIVVVLNWLEELKQRVPAK
jgi:Tol biopolymer transport system component